MSDEWITTKVAEYRTGFAQAANALERHKAIEAAKVSQGATFWSRIRASLDLIQNSFNRDFGGSTEVMKSNYDLQSMNYRILLTWVGSPKIVDVSYSRSPSKISWKVAGEPSVNLLAEAESPETVYYKGDSGRYTNADDIARQIISDLIASANRATATAD